MSKHTTTDIKTLLPQIAGYLGAPCSYLNLYNEVYETKIDINVLSFIEDGVIVTLHLRSIDSITEQEAVEITKGMDLSGVLDCFDNILLKDYLIETLKDDRGCGYLYASEVNKILQECRRRQIFVDPEIADFVTLDKEVANG